MEKPRSPFTFSSFWLANFQTLSIIFAFFFWHQSIWSKGDQCVALFEVFPEISLPQYPPVKKGSFADQAIQTERQLIADISAQIQLISKSVRGIEKFAKDRQGWRRNRFDAALDRFVDFQITTLTGGTHYPKPYKGRNARDLRAFVRNSFTMNGIETTEISPNEARLYAYDAPKAVQMLFPVMDSLSKIIDKKYMTDLELALRTRALKILYSYSTILTAAQLKVFIKADILLHLQQAKLLQVENSIFESDYIVVDHFMNLTDDMTTMNDLVQKAAVLRQALADVSAFNPSIWETSLQLRTAMQPYGPHSGALKKTPELKAALTQDLARKIFPNKEDTQWTEDWVRRAYQLVRKLRFEMSLGFVSPRLELWRNYRTIRFLLLHLAEARLYNRSLPNQRLYTFDDMYAMLVSQDRDHLPRFIEPHVQAMFENLLIRFKDMTDEHQFLLVLSDIVDKHPEAFQ